MFRISSTTLAAITVLVTGCHDTRGASADRLNTANAPAPVSPAVAPSAPSPSAVSSQARGASTGATTVSPASGTAVGNAPQPAEPPKLQAVLSKPFPDGATDEQVCNAIANTGEMDIWRRFGHLVPLHIPGSLLIVDASPSQQTKVEAFIGAYYGGSYYPSVKACSRGRLMVYVRGLKGYEPMDEREPGVVHLARQLTQQLGVPVPEYFGYFNDQQRLSDYCRADAELCEQLVKLDYANKTGLCNRALVSAGNDAREDELLPLCKSLPADIKACTYVNWRRDERQAEMWCDCRLRAALRLPAMYEDCAKFIQ